MTALAVIVRPSYSSTWRCRNANKSWEQSGHCRISLQDKLFFRQLVNMFEVVSFLANWLASSHLNWLESQSFSKQSIVSLVASVLSGNRWGTTASSLGVCHWFLTGIIFLFASGKEHVAQEEPAGKGTVRWSSCKTGLYPHALFGLNPSSAPIHYVIGAMHQQMFILKESLY